MSSEQANKPVQIQASSNTDGSKDRQQSPGEIFVACVRESKSWQKDGLAEIKRWQKDIIQAIYEESSGPQPLMYQQPLSEDETQLQNNFVNLLRYPGMTNRYSRIAEAHKKTFQWIWCDPKAEDKPWQSFVTWLEDDDSLYWITGKAGSGKSTLIKYLYQDERTFNHLRFWAQGTQLVTAAFFFWNSGSSTEMSQLGLLGSLLFQILSSKPALLPQLFRERWEAYRLFRDQGEPLILLELQNALQRLQEEDSQSPTKFCLFVDGLDEFAGDPVELLALLKKLAAANNVKICVSSRPWVIFQDALGHAPGLLLQDLTSWDISHYVHSSFHRNHGFSDLEQREPVYASQLISTIVEKAAGVFLWVHLVVASLLAGLGNADRVKDLQRRLDMLPPELENLYQKMLDSLEPFYLEHASELFQLVRASPDRRALFLSYGDDAIDTVISQEISPLTKNEAISRVDVMRRRINSRCKGLLELGADPLSFDDVERSLLFVKSYPLVDPTVQYLHRTVKDFVEGRQVWNWLLAATKGAYATDLALCKAYLMELKLMRHESLDIYHFWSVVAACINYAQRASFEASGNPGMQEVFTLLDQLDRTGKQHARRLGENWDFLSWMVKADMRFYIKAKIDEGCFSDQSSLLSRLLIDACLRNSHMQDLLEVAFPSSNMIDLLLEKGASPDAQVAGLDGTVWDIIRKSKVYKPKELDEKLHSTRWSSVSSSSDSVTNSPRPKIGVFTRSLRARFSHGRAGGKRGEEKQLVAFTNPWQT